MSQSVGKLLTEKPVYLESLRKLSSHSIHLEVSLMTSTATRVFNPNVVNINLDPILCSYYSAVASTVRLGLAAEGSFLTYIPAHFWKHKCKCSLVISPVVEDELKIIIVTIVPFEDWPCVQHNTSVSWNCSRSSCRMLDDIQKGRNYWQIWRANRFKKRVLAISELICFLARSSWQCSQRKQIRQSKVHTRWTSLIFFGFFKCGCVSCNWVRCYYCAHLTFSL